MWTLARSGALFTLLAAGSIAVAPATAATDRVDAPTWSGAISRIFQERCQTCHRPGDIAPMAFTTYAEVRPWAKAIRKAVSERTMPPWHADAPPGTFLNEMALSQSEIDAVAAWVDSGAPEGDRGDLPAPREFARDGWKAGTPDLVFEMPVSYTLPAAVADEYRCFILPNAVPRDSWYEAFEVRPGNPRIVHHAVAFGDTTGKAAAEDRETPEEGFLCGMGDPGVHALIDAPMLAGWVPGNGAAPLAEVANDGIASKIAAGTTIVLQLHYHNATGENQPDRSSVAFYLTRSIVRKQPQATILGNWDLHIRAGDPRSEHVATWTAPQDVALIALFPHMHYLGTDMTLDATYPDGRKELLFNLPRYDFNWQHTYRLRRSIPLPEGTVLRLVAHHDNSAANPNQQFDPPRDIFFGEATDAEMALMSVAYTLDDQDLAIEPELPRAATSSVAPAMVTETLPPRR
jgi:mono/diheme cytochrome c family protein